MVTRQRLISHIVRNGHEVKSQWVFRFQVSTYVNVFKSAMWAYFVCLAKGDHISILPFFSALQLVCFVILLPGGEKGEVVCRHIVSFWTLYNFIRRIYCKSTFYSLKPQTSTMLNYKIALMCWSYSHITGMELFKKSIAKRNLIECLGGWLTRLSRSCTSAYWRMLCTICGSLVLVPTL